MKLRHDQEANLVVEFDQKCDVPLFTTHSEETQMNQFKHKSKYFHFPHCSNAQIDKFEMRILAFSKQYGQKNEKTTSIHMNYLEAVREAGVTCLKNREYQKTCSFMAECLSFCNPVHDEIFYEKFLIVKIDALNKLLFCIFEIDGLGTDFKNQKNRFQNELAFTLQFLEELKKFPKYENLKKSENCLLELNYFYLGRLYRKLQNNPKAIESFLQAEELIKSKTSGKTISKNESMCNFLATILTKVQYKLSKCYREEEKFEEQQYYEDSALQGARLVNDKLYMYIHKKVKFFLKKREFEERLMKIDGRKRIQDEILKQIEEAKQNEIPSLYDAYLHTTSRSDPTRHFIDK